MIEKKSVCICIHKYREAFFEYSGKEISVDKDYLEFDKYLGLKYIVGYSDMGKYNFLIKNKKKWFLAQLKYDL